MQVFRQIDPSAVMLAGWGVRVMLLAADDEESAGQTAHRLAGLGGVVQCEDDVFVALDAMICNASGFGLFVVDCDPFGGLSAGHQILSMLRKGVADLPVILITADCGEQVFPTGLHDPIILRAPLTAVSLRVGFEHAMRDRLIIPAA